eukprot:CAMPEP_0168176172 /NCGR_PEP_ID=MMETSP0139_2-20121125/7607_1 /TAXON_ID=44445 /ORGANISM="Pseudo-nitzschia australis, Strain 10249 10 AB" /LENGTH=459 /DNA_ID=CAMNT_0008094795 /DNA_START=144 /DNA_END=1523 /DNA_ORIENTATION=-
MIELGHNNEKGTKNGTKNPERCWTVYARATSVPWLATFLIIAVSSLLIPFVFLFSGGYSNLDCKSTVSKHSTSNTNTQNTNTQNTNTQTQTQTHIVDHKLEYESCRKNDVVPENWCLDDTNVPRYVGGKTWPPRNVRHYNHEGYERCLANKTLVFIGDSRVRYQFMSLAMFLESKHFLRCEDYVAIEMAHPITTNINNNNGAAPDPNCFMINERALTNHTWNHWYQQTTARLPGSLCDCYRPPETFTAQDTYENRFIRRSTPFGGDINLVYLENFEDMVRMNADFPPYAPYDSNDDDDDEEFFFNDDGDDDNDVDDATTTTAMSNSTNSNKSTRCEPGNCGLENRTNVFEGNLNATLYDVVPKLNATHVFASSGWLFRDYSCHLKEFRKHHPNIQAYMITHPTKFSTAILKCDSDLIDRSVVTLGVPPYWFWDRGHVLGILNEEYNHRLIERICPIEPL